MIAAGASVLATRPCTGLIARFREPLARQIPLGGEPAELITRIETYDAWLAASAGTPKLLMTFQGSPTLLITRQMAD